jgi:hypothetical protein
MVQHRNLFQDNNFPKFYLPPIRGSSYHKNEIKMIRRGHYSSNNFQDSAKIKSTKKKTLDYLSRVLFFNAFELGAESGNQVFSNEALRSRDFYFRVLRSLVVLSFPQLLSFSSVFPKPLSETLRRSSDRRIPI